LVSRSLPQKDKRVRAEADILIRPDFARAFLPALSTTARYEWSESDFASLHAVACSQILIEKDPLASDNQIEPTDSFGGGCEYAFIGWIPTGISVAVIQIGGRGTTFNAAEHDGLSPGPQRPSDH
jgi:hypothetical protein